MINFEDETEPGVGSLTGPMAGTGISTTLRPCRRIAFHLLQFLFLTNVYRAWTQSFTIDEAYTYNHFIAPMPTVMFNSFNANHHILHTLLCFASVKLFGLSELTMRVPSLLGGLLYFVGVFRLCRYLFGDGARFLFTVALLTTNPFVLDYFSVARGYGLALAFFTWAVYQALRSLEEPDSRKALFRSGLCLSLSVTANLTFLIPAVALAVSLFTLMAGRQRLARFTDQLAGPALVTAFLILALPLSHVEPAHFYVGSKNLRIALSGMAHSALFYKLRFPLVPAWTGEYHRLVEQFLPIWGPALVLIAVVAIGIEIYRRRQRETIGGAAMLSAATLALSVCFVFLGHFIFNMVYPLPRTALYFYFLFPLASLAACGWLSRQAGPLRWMGRAWQLGLAALLLIFCLEYNTRYYLDWRYDAATKSIVEMIRARHNPEDTLLRVGGNQAFGHAIAFYRERYGLPWLQHVNTEHPGVVADYYLYQPPEAHFVEQLRLRKLWVSPISGAILAIPPK